ncbi:MAG: hypothetical protein A6F71_07950 [Cycloclasticus sp. symbiont of Poecilosclerida sp. M]|nr:MAG: hypothetical protein A6F71_07950 [Cycloclasticus sp. symbiont of Poecilosclerida sp. M]
MLTLLSHHFLNKYLLCKGLPSGSPFLFGHTYENENILTLIHRFFSLHALADSDKKNAKPLDDLMGDKVVLLSFIYATCNDVNGCPLSTSVFHKIKRRLSKAGLKKDLRLITLSFDPKHDTPEMMAKYAKSLETKQTDWLFLTTASQKELRPILEGYNQTIQQEYNEEGQSTGTF